ncbi:NAC domain-containing protein 2-like [Rutidosis leptorrhynchoides]|uniref:NAC domain-containing protein 2-like n=1 Tax=Rutidosis leptorrhynchoides TaxID=125765 RepID=UPI003A9A5DB7
MDSSSLPPGFVFQPSEQELLRYFLFPMVTNGFAYLPELDFYGGSIEVPEIWEKHGGLALEEESIGREGDLDIYLFTFLKRKSSNSSTTTTKKSKKSTNGSAKFNYIRTVGTGKWEGENAFKPVFDDDHDNNMPRRQLGSKKRFRYVNPKKRELDGEWSMMEFNLEGSYLLHEFPNLRTDIVLCRIRKKKNSKSKKRNLKQIDRQESGVACKRSHVYHHDPQELLNYESESNTNIMNMVPDIGGYY